jgi:hypothetical protein
MLSAAEIACVRAYLDALSSSQPACTAADHPITDQQAACVGLVSPACTACHHSAPCGYALTPTWAPTPPPNTSTSFDGGACGI